MAILGFGSLLDDPGVELEGRMVRRIPDVRTPFRVEFARSSRTRGGAPTLVPVDLGGAHIRGGLLVLAADVDEELARDLLYRRETWRVAESVTYREARADWIRAIRPFAGVDVCLYSAHRANISPRTPARLAELAIESAAGEAGVRRRDGISYLLEQKRRGVRTPLMPEYESEILRRTRSQDLASAWTRVRPLVEP